MTTAHKPQERIHFDRSEFVIRPVEAGDRAALEAIAAQIWDGHDYLPHVFDAWLADKAGLFAAGVLGGRVVAVAKLTHMGGDQWWMEGMRVDPAYRGLGIARIMHHYIVNYARRYAPGTLRLSTASDNLAIRKIAAETAFQEVAAFTAYGAAALDGEPVERLVALGAADADRAWTALEHMPHFEASGRVLEDSWRFFPLSPELLQVRLAAGMVYGWFPDGAQSPMSGIAILNAPRGSKPGEEDTESRLYIGYADAVPEAMGPMARALQRLAAQQGHLRVSWKILVDESLLAALESAGYECRWDMQILLFSRDLSLTGHASFDSDDNRA